MMRKSQLFTLDLMLALIPLTIVLGLSANALSGLSTQMQSYAHWYSMQQQVNDASEVLIKTAGEPPDWNASYPASGPSVLGLANYTPGKGVEPYVLDSDKLGALNATVDGQPLHQLAIPRLFGGFNPAYYNLSFRGAEVNTTNLTLSFSNGSRARVSDVYAARRLALVEMEELVGIAEEVGHFATNATACCEQGQQRVYSVNFSVASGDKSQYNFWLVGEYQSGAATTTTYGVSPYHSVSCDCTGAFPESAPTLNAANPSFKEEITLYTTEGTTNILYVRPSGNGLANYYLIKSPKDTSSGDIEPEATGLKAVDVILEVGI